MSATGTSWEQTQDYIAFIASSLHLTNEEERKFTGRLLKKHSRGERWTMEELDRIREIIVRRTRQIQDWEVDLHISKGSKSKSTSSNELYEY